VGKLGRGVKTSVHCIKGIIYQAVRCPQNIYVALYCGCILPSVKSKYINRLHGFCIEL